MEARIEKPWCVYGYTSRKIPEHLGKIIRETEISIEIEHSESRSDTSYWRKKYVERFDTLEEAIKYFIANKPEHGVGKKSISDEDIRRDARQNFPSQYQNK